jgi:hypothetical protein
VDADAPGRYFALHDVESLSVFDHPLSAAASRTPWRQRATVHRRDFTTRLYRLWRRFDDPLA